MAFTRTRPPLEVLWGALGRQPGKWGFWLPCSWEHLHLWRGMTVSAPQLPVPRCWQCGEVQLGQQALAVLAAEW